MKIEALIVLSCIVLCGAGPTVQGNAVILDGADAGHPDGTLGQPDAQTLLTSRGSISTVHIEAAAVRVSGTQDFAPQGSFLKVPDCPDAGGVCTVPQRGMICNEAGEPLFCNGSNWVSLM